MLVNAGESLTERFAVLQAARPAADRRHYRITVRDFGKGRAEFMTHLPHYGADSALLAAPKPPGETLEVSEERKAELVLLRAVRRAKQMVRWKVKALEGNHLLTLTYRENMTDVVRLAKDWKEFVRLVRKRFPTWRYVMVREYQERGALHIHCALVGRQDVKHLRACWWAIVGAEQGNIDVRGPTKRWGNEGDKWNPHRLSAYMCKYMVKDFKTAEAAKKRYWASQGIEIPRRVYWLGATNFSEAVAETYAYVAAVGCKDTSLWASDDWRCIWVDASG